MYPSIHLSFSLASHEKKKKTCTHVGLWGSKYIPKHQTVENFVKTCTHPASEAGRAAVGHVHPCCRASTPLAVQKKHNSLVDNCFALKQCHHRSDREGDFGETKHLAPANNLLLDLRHWNYQVLKKNTSKKTWFLRETCLAIFPTRTSLDPLLVTIPPNACNKTADPCERGALHDKDPTTRSTCGQRRGAGTRACAGWRCFSHSFQPTFLQAHAEAKRPNKPTAKCKNKHFQHINFLFDNGQ